MTDILDLEGWNVIAKHVDGDDYLIEAEYAVAPTACTKCGNIGNLYKHGPITPMEAWNELGVYRLAARVADLKEAGHKIVKQTVSVANRFGESCRVARYSMEK